MAAASSGTGIVQQWLLLPMAGDEQHRDTCFVSPAVTLYNVRPRSTNDTITFMIPILAHRVMCAHVVFFIVVTKQDMSLDWRVALPICS